MVIFRDDIKVELIQSYGSDEMVAKAARVSTGNDQVEGQKIEGLIRYLLKAGHNSPVGHCGATFRVEAPLFVRDQWFRHRTQEYNAKSLRFSEADPEFYIPSKERPLHNAGSGAHPDLVQLDDDSDIYYVLYRLRISYKDAWKVYQDLLYEGVAEEIARAVLPSGLYTSFYATANLWNWIKFLEKRIPSEKNKPQLEIVQAADQVKAHLTELFPVVMANAFTD